MSTILTSSYYNIILGQHEQKAMHYASGVSIGVALFVMLVDCVPRFEAY